MSYKKPSFLEFLIPAIVSLALMVFFHESGNDERLSSLFFVKNKWIYRDNFFLEKILHKGGVLFSAVILVGFIGYFFYLWIKKTNDRKRLDYFGFIVFSTVMTILAIFTLKRWSTLPCPWNSIIYGGGTLRPSIWQMFSSNFPNAHCFPGGHSSAGYSLLSLYFGYFCIYGKKNYLSLVPGILLGVVFGITQQMRGAHFLSHDMGTIFVSIISSWVTFLIYSYYNNNDEV